MNWTELVRTIWPVIASITPFVLLGGFAWLKTQFPTKIDLEKLRSDTARDLEAIRAFSKNLSDLHIANAQRVESIERDLDRAPSKLDLSKDIGKVAERVGHVEAGIESLIRQISTHNSYLQALIEKQLK